MIVLYILLGIVALIVAGMIGFLISAIKSFKDLKNIEIELEELAENYFETIKLADEAFDDFRKDLWRAYSEFVRLRDEGVENLDDIIGYLGELLKED